MEFSLEPFQERIEKPWGYEILFTPEGAGYTGKLLAVKKGKQSSIHYHTAKKETLFLFSGNMILWVEDKDGAVQKFPMEPFKGYTMEPGQRHRYQAIEESFIMEASLPETGTTVRVEDDFSRPDETEELRKEKNRGWKES